MRSRIRFHDTGVSKEKKVAGLSLYWKSNFWKLRELQNFINLKYVDRIMIQLLCTNLWKPDLSQIQRKNLIKVQFPCHCEFLNHALTAQVTNYLYMKITSGSPFKCHTTDQCCGSGYTDKESEEKKISFGLNW